MEQNQTSLPDQVTLPNGQVASLPPMPAFGDRVNNHPNANTNNKYYWMKNAKGRLVPVDAEKVGEVLSRGYVHTDGKLMNDDPSKQVQPPAPAPDSAVVLAQLAELMLKQNQQLAQQNEQKKK